MATLLVWSAAAAKVMLLQPSSAAAERVFSIYRTALENSRVEHHRMTSKHPLCHSTTDGEWGYSLLSCFSFYMFSGIVACFACIRLLNCNSVCLS